MSDLSACLSQGGELARRSSLLSSDELLSYYYDDVRTVYDIFQRGLQVSSKSKIKDNILNMSGTTYLNSFEMQLGIGGLCLAILWMYWM